MEVFVSVLKESVDDPVIIASTNFCFFPGWLEKILSLFAEDNNIALILSTDISENDTRRELTKTDILSAFDSQKYLIALSRRVHQKIGSLLNDSVLPNVIGDFVNNAQSAGLSCIRLPGIIRSISQEQFDEMTQIVQQGKQSVLDGRLKEAENLLDKVLGKNSEVLSLMSEIGSKYFGQKKFKESEELFRKILWHEPSYWEARVSLSVLLWEMGRTKESIEEMDKAWKTNPERRQVVWNYGQILIRQGNQKKACDIFREYLKKHPGDKEMEIELNRMNKHSEVVAVKHSSQSKEKRTKKKRK